MASNPMPNLVKLNVGGVRYMTTLQTLTSRGVNFLTQMVQHDAQGNILSFTDEDGRYLFIDRNGRLFEVVLDYLRTGTLEVGPGVSRAAVARELDFYGIAPQAEPPAVSHVAAEVQKREAQIAAILAEVGEQWEEDIKKQFTSGKVEARLYWRQAPNGLYGPFKTEQARSPLFHHVLCEQLTRHFGLRTAATYNVQSGGLEVRFGLGSPHLSSAETMQDILLLLQSVITDSTETSRPKIRTF